jgi:hypothetical protein
LVSFAAHYKLSPMLKYSILLFCFFVSSLQIAFAGDLNIVASVDKNVMGLNEQLVLEVNITGQSLNIPSLELPQLNSFTSYSNGRSQNISIINGKITSSLNFRYVLVPKSAGKFVIPALVLEQGGQKYSTQPITIEVTQQSQANPQQQATAQPPTQEQSGEIAGKRNLFITAAVDKHKAYVNEQITYTFRFYRRVQLTSNPGYTPPDLAGFWTEDSPPKNFNTVIDGQTYLVTEVKTMLFPTKPGTFTLGKATLQCRVEDFNSNDFFNDDFFKNFFSSSKVQVLNTEPITVNILGLPEQGKPRNFDGLVGNYTIAAQLDKTKTKTNEAVTLSLTVSGHGNIKTVTEPKLPDWPDFRKYETVSSLNIDKSENAIKGSKSFKTVIVPQTPGKKVISPVSISFFDPARKSYVTVNTEPLSLDVEQGKALEAFTPPSDNAQNQVKVVSQDIRYIKSLTSWKTAAAPLYQNQGFIILNLIPMIGLVGVLLVRMRADKLNKDVAYARRSRASGVARKYLKQAKKLLGVDRAADFYLALSRALYKYIADKTNVSSEGLTIEKISEMLANRGLTPEKIVSIKEVLEECDLVRYAPASVSLDSMERSCVKTEQLINALEKVLR